jgi:hypothetical protein
VFYISNRADGQAELFEDNGISWHEVYSDCRQDTIWGPMGVAVITEVTHERAGFYILA